MTSLTRVAMVTCTVFQRNSPREWLVDWQDIHCSLLPAEHRPAFSAPHRHRSALSRHRSNRFAAIRGATCVVRLEFGPVLGRDPTKLLPCFEAPPAYRHWPPIGDGCLRCPGLVDVPDRPRPSYLTITPGTLVRHRVSCGDQRWSRGPER